MLCISPFDSQAPMFQRGDLLVRVGCKETEDPIPVCYCFGFTRSDIENEVTATGDSTVGSELGGSEGGNCACEVKNPSGKCCLGTVTEVIRDSTRTLQGATKVAE